MVIASQKKHSTSVQIFYDAVCFTLGSILYGCSVSVFSEPNQIAPGGVTGLSIVLNSLFYTPVATMVLILNIPLMIWAVIELGYKLVAKTIFAIILTSIVIDLIAILVPPYQGDKMLVAIFAGVTEGAGLALIFIRGGTTGGTDTAARLLGKRFPHVSMGRLMMLIDFTVVLIAAFAFQSIESAMYAVIVIFVATQIIDAMLYGTDVGTGKLLFIISRKSNDVADAIIHKLSRGVTILKSRGAYTGSDNEVLLCAVRKYEVYRLTQLVREIDNKAFIIIGDAGQINGEGFKENAQEEKTLRDIIKKRKK